MLHRVSQSYRVVGRSKSQKKSNSAVASVIESLEIRRFMSVAATTILGPQDQGDTWDYSISEGTTVEGTETVTEKGQTTFQGVTVNDRQTVSTSLTTGNVDTDDSYTASGTGGILEYGQNDITKNSSGGVISSSMDVDTPPDVALPTDLTAGVTYTSTYTDTYTDTTPGTTDTTPTTDSETDTVVLSSETTQPITVTAGTYNCYLLTVTSSTTSSDGTVSPGIPVDEYLSPSVGLVEVMDNSSSSTSYVEQLTSTTADGGSGGGGGGGTTTTGGVTPLVLKTTLPTSVVAGGKAHGTATVSLANTTESTIKEPVTTQVYASLDGAVDSSSVLLGTLSKTETIRSGAALDVPVDIKSLPASLNGTYTLLAKVTDTAGSASSTTGPTVDVTAAFVAFSNETITTNLGSSLVAGSKTKAIASITLTNTGNVESTGSTTVDLLVSPDGTVASGTAIRSLPETIALQPGKSKTVKVPLQTLPNVPDNSYFVVATLTDPNGDVTTVATTSTVALAQAFVKLTPALSAITPAAKGAGTVSLTITNNGNSVPVGASQIVLYASAANTISGATQLISQSVVLPLKVGASKTLKLKLTAAEMASITTDGLLLAAVTDPTGGVLTATTPAVG